MPFANVERVFTPSAARAQLRSALLVLATLRFLKFQQQHTPENCHALIF